MSRGFVARAVALLGVVCVTLGSAPVPSRTDRDVRRLGSMKLLFSGLSASLDPVNPVVPKNTPSGVNIVVTAGGEELSLDEAEHFFGGTFEVEGELAGPGLTGALTLRGEPGSFLLPFPALNRSGDYVLSNVRIVADGKTVLDVAPAQASLRVIEQVLITSVQTRALTLDELKERGVVFDGDDVVGFEFSLGMMLESKPVNISFPVAFDRKGVAVPQPLSPPLAPARTGVSLNLPPLPTIVPLMLEAEDATELPEIELPGGGMAEVRIPSVLVIPGDVGFLKQFFSAQLFVANGAPGGARLNVRDIEATIDLPEGDDGVLGTADDPLALPELTDGIQPETLPVLGVGPDGEAGTTDDVVSLAPGQQGQAEFLVRGEKEGFHTLGFDIAAVLEGLPTGPINVKGRADGGVLVRNPFLDVTFTVPSVVRAQEPLKVFVNVRNIGKGPANRIDVSFNERALSGLKLADGADATQRIDGTLLQGESATLTYDFEALRTGKVVATYLRFDGLPASGQVNFTLGLAERGVPLSPDTLVLPAPVDALDETLVQKAMRVLGQAWSVANAPVGTLPPDVRRIQKATVVEKALALAEAGLRITLGAEPESAVRDLLFDFYGRIPLDDGFDQLLRTTNAGADLATAITDEIAPAITAAGGIVDYENETAILAASGADFVSFAVDDPTLGVTVTDGAARTVGSIPATVLLPSGDGTLGLVLQPTASPYTFSLSPAAAGPATLSLTLPRGDGTFVRGAGSIDFPDGATARLVADLFRPDGLVVEVDADGDNLFETEVPLATTILSPQGPTLVSANVIGPELLDGASRFGFDVAVLFDRVVSDAASSPEGYAVSGNAVRAAKRQLSGRLVFLSLERPEGPYVPVTLEVSGITDTRGVAGPALDVPLGSLLVDDGAIVSGRVFEADGTPVAFGTVGYTNFRGSDDCRVGENVLFSQVPLDGAGNYELHYVRRDHCGGPFGILYTDPDTGELRRVTGFVRAGGERIVLDLALLGRGAVTGVVTESGQPVPNADVVVTSITEPQSGGVTTTDGDGRYNVFDIVVGPVSVKAASGISVGSNSGRIARAGTTAVVDVLLDPGKARVSGTVSKLEKGELSIVPGVQVIYSIKSDGHPVPVGVAVTGADGRYVLDDMPHGPYDLEAILDAEARIKVSATSSPGDDIVQNLVIPIAEETELGTLRGHVVLPDTTPVEGGIVRVGSRAVLTDTSGFFEIPGVPVKPGQTQTLLATDAKGLRSGSAGVVVSLPGQIIDGLVITLSGLGTAELTVRDADGNAVPNQLVGLIGNCASSCGCAFGTTDSSGVVSFNDLRPGTHFFKAVRIDPNFVDLATGTARIDGEGAVGRGVLTFAGVGMVTGTVFLPGGVEPAVGAEVELAAKVFNRDACELRTGVSHRGRTDAEGKFSFTGVNLGQVSATATHPFANKRVGATKTLTKATPVDFRLELVDTIAGELSGTVYLPDGVTPAGGGVELTAVGPLPEITVRTAPDGTYAFAPILPQGMYTITVLDPVTGFLVQEQVFLGTSDPVEHDFRLKGRGTVTVRVLDAAGAPVSSAFVRLTETEYPRGVFEAVVEPSEGGVVTFENVFEGRFSVEAKDVFGRDGGRVPSVLPGPDASVSLDVRLNAVGTVTGHFRLPNGDPIPFGVVKLIAGGQVIGQTTSAGGGDVGSFRFDYVPVGSIRLEAEDPLTARQGFVTGELAAQDATLDIDVVTLGLGRVEGTVTADGAPQDSAHVDLVSGTFRACTTADSNGFYYVEGVPEGKVVVTASLAGGFLAGTNGATLIGDGSTLLLNVSLRDSATVVGTVSKAASTEAAPPSLVTIRVGGAGGGSQTTTTDPVDGTFRFDRVPAGLATVDVDVLGGIDKATRVVDVLPGVTSNLAISLNGVGSIRVSTFDSSGLPTAGKLTLLGGGDFPYQFVISVASDGNVVLPEVLAGPVTAKLELPGPAPLFGTKSGVLLPSTELSLRVDIEDTGTVRGIVLRADGAPAAGATVLVELSSNRGTISTSTNALGAFEVTGVPIGELAIEVVDPFSGGVGNMTGLSIDSKDAVIDGLVIHLDDSPVSVTAVDPPDGAIDVLPEHDVRVTFSDPVARLNGAVTVKDATGAIVSSAAVLAPDGLSATIATTFPDAKLLTVQVSTSLEDLFGRHPVSVFTSKFRTVDRTPPKVITTDPPDGAFEVPPDAVITVGFDEPLSDATDFPGLVKLRTTTGLVAGTSERSGAAEARFTPDSPLEDDRTFDVVVNGAVDELGNTQQSPTTVAKFATKDTESPGLSMLSPAPNSWIHLPKQSVQVTALDATSGVDPATRAMKIDGVSVPTTFSGNRIVFNPTSDYSEGPHTVEASIADRSGNIGSFSGGFQVDLTPPSIAVIESPSAGAVLTGVVRFKASADDALSQVGRIDIRRNSSLFVSLFPPSFERDFDTSSLSDGDFDLTAHAVDVAGNAAPPSAPVPVRFENKPLVITFQQPSPGARVRDSVVVRATASEPVTRIEFEVGTVSAIDDTSPYEVTLDLSTLDSGVHTITATGFGVNLDVQSATRDIVIDREPPDPPNADLIAAEPPQSGESLIHGRAGAVEAGAVVDIVNTANLAATSTTAGSAGSFAARLPAEVGDVIALTATDDLGNESAETLIAVSDTASLPPSSGANELVFEGVLADRVSLATLEPDGSLDAVFSFSVEIGDGVTRRLSYIELEGPGLRSTRVPTAIVGVAAALDAPVLNGPDGAVSFLITSGATLTLFTSDEGFIQEGETYTARAAFDDGSLFVASVTIVPASDAVGVPHAARVSASPSTVIVPLAGEGTTLVTVDDLHDIHGNPVPDGARVGIAVADMATTDPRGTPIRSAGGRILDGEPASNRVEFRVFTVDGGSVTVQYGSDTVTPAAVNGALAVVQVLAADDGGNVLGTEAIATLDLNLRRETDEAIVYVDRQSLYADGTRPLSSGIRVEVRDASGIPVPDGTRVVLAVGNCASRVGGFCVLSYDGTIAGGEASPSGAQFRVFDVVGGEITTEYQLPTTKSLNPGGLNFARVQVLRANPDGTVVGNQAIGTGDISVVGAADAEIDVTPPSVPLVSPARPVQVRVRHVHDTRGNLVPDDATLVLSAASCATRQGGFCSQSAGGEILEGIPDGPSDLFKRFTLVSGEIEATYESNGVTARVGTSKIAGIQLAMADPGPGEQAVAYQPILLLAPKNAVGSADPPSLLADGRLHTSTVTFSPVLDGFGQPLPDGSKVLASSANCAARVGGFCVLSVTGTQILNGAPAAAGDNYRLFTVTDGKLVVEFGNEGVTANPGQTREANVVLLQSGPAGELIGNQAFGIVPIPLAGLTSATLVASPTMLEADGNDRRASITVSNIRDSLGNLVPDGTRVGLSGESCATRVGGFCVIAQVKTTIVGGEPAFDEFRSFTVRNGQVVAELSTLGVTITTGSKTAVAQLAAVRTDGSLISNQSVGTVEVELVPPSADLVVTSPLDLFADGSAGLSQVTVAMGTIPSGVQVALTVADCAAEDDQAQCIPSAGGLLLTGGVTPGDGDPVAGDDRFRLFTVSGGEVKAVYSSEGLTAGIGETRVARVSVVPTDGAGGVASTMAITTGEVRLRGMTSAMSSGPGVLPLAGGEAEITFSGIRDAVGNVVPDGSTVLVSVANGATRDAFTGQPIASAGGTLLDGDPSAAGPSFRAYAVSGGSVTVTYSTAGASPGTARIQIAPARSDGTLIGDESLVDGVHEVELQ